MTASKTPGGGEMEIWIDPRTKEPCRRCYGTGKMPPWPGSVQSVPCGVCRAEFGLAATQSVPSPEPVSIEGVVHAAMRDNVNLGLYNGCTIQEWMARALAAEAGQAASPELKGKGQTENYADGYSQAVEDHKHGDPRTDEEIKRNIWCLLMHREAAAIIGDDEEAIYCKCTECGRTWQWKKAEPTPSPAQTED